jgi:hypothetical protein
MSEESISEKCRKLLEIADRLSGEIKKLEQAKQINYCMLIQYQKQCKHSYEPMRMNHKIMPGYFTCIHCNFSFLAQ